MPPSGSASADAIDPGNQDQKSTDPKKEQEISRVDFEPGDEGAPTPAGQSSTSISREASPPPLPPRPRNIPLAHHVSSASLKSLRPSSGSARPQLQSKATTALSLEGVQILTHGGSQADSSATPGTRQVSASVAGYNISRSGSDIEDTPSVRSMMPVLDAGADMESILGEVLPDRPTSTWKTPFAPVDPEKSGEASLFLDDDDFDRTFAHEFDELEEIKEDGSNEGMFSSLQASDVR